MLSFQAAVEEEMRNRSKLSDLIATKGNTKALYLSLGLVTAQQLCGINAVLFYSQTIFTSSAGSLGGAESTIIIGVVMLLSSGITPLVVERLGRRLLLLASAVGMIIGLVREKRSFRVKSCVYLETAVLNLMAHLEYSLYFSSRQNWNTKLKFIIVSRI